MSFAEGFDIGYLKISAERQENVFLSVTPSMRLGPGIQRDGITAPRMTDPHTVPFVVGTGDVSLKDRDYPATTNAYVQRAGTRTLFEHILKFHKDHGAEYRIIGVQSCGDLTMNPWHVALTWEAGRPVLHHLDTPGDPLDIKEPVHERTYRCLVKWKPGKRDFLYEFKDLKFDLQPRGFEAREVLLNGNESPSSSKEGPVYITEDIEFALSGKVIVDRGHDVSLSNAIDRFQDVRHIFNVPEVPVRDLQGQEKGMINFGEFVLFHDLNARRAALACPIIVGLRIPNHDLVVHIEDLEKELKGRYHYKKCTHSPTRRGEYRMYTDDSVEIYYRHNVYPFGVIGGRKGAIVCLASGGLSGRVGNTLEGIIRVMFDFFGSEDALVLDEGYDTFHILNPNPKKKQDEPDEYQHDNDEILRQVAAFTLWRMELDKIESTEAYNKVRKEDQYKQGPDPWAWQLNRPIAKVVEDYCRKEQIKPQPPSELNVMAVEPRRSQMRSVLIFAVRRNDLFGSQ